MIRIPLLLLTIPLCLEANPWKCPKRYTQPSNACTSTTIALALTAEPMRQRLDGPAFIATLHNMLVERNTLNPGTAVDIVRQWGRCGGGKYLFSTREIQEAVETQGPVMFSHRSYTGMVPHRTKKTILQPTGVTRTRHIFLLIGYHDGWFRVRTTSGEKRDSWLHRENMERLVRRNDDYAYGLLLLPPK